MLQKSTDCSCVTAKSRAAVIFRARKPNAAPASSRSARPTGVECGTYFKSPGRFEKKGGEIKEE